MVDFSKALKKNQPPALAIIYEDAILSLMDDSKEHYAVPLFQQLTEIFEDFPKDILKFYGVMEILKQKKLVDSRDEVEQIDWDIQSQKVRLRRTLYWKL